MLMVHNTKYYWIFILGFYKMALQKIYVEYEFWWEECKSYYENWKTFTCIYKPNICRTRGTASYWKDDDEKRDVKLVVELKSWQSNTGRWKGSQKDVVNKIGRENETQKIMFSPE